jgi:Mg-chelatase subunit ChlD
MWGEIPMGVKLMRHSRYRAIFGKLAGWLLVWVMAAALPSMTVASDMATFRVSQTVAQLPEITVYLEASNTDGSTALPVPKNNLAGTLGTYPATVKSLQTFGATGEGVAYIFLVDVSKSLKQKQFGQMRQVLNTWIDSMTERDRAAVISFGADVRTIQDFTADKGALKKTVAGLSPTDNYTKLHECLVRAEELGDSRMDTDIPRRRAILILSDGEDDHPGGLTRQMVLEKLRVNPVPIYAVGFSNLQGAEKERNLKSLGEFAVTSGGSFLRVDDAQFDQACDRMWHRIRNVWVAQLQCDACQGDGNVHRLQLTLADDGKKISEGMDIRLLASATPQPVEKAAEKKAGKVKSLDVEPSKAQEDWTPFVVVGIILLALIIGIIVWRRTRRPLMPPPPPPSRYGKRLRFTPIRGDAMSEPQEVTLYEHLVLGRDAQCDIALTDDKKLSRQHCELTLQKGEIYIRDLGSKNGTLVNGVPITGPVQLENDDTILLGNTELRLSILSEE